MKKIIILLITIGILFLLVACTKVSEKAAVEPQPTMGVKVVESSPAAPATAPGVQRVEINNDKFNPVTLQVNVGDNIEWLNKDDETHTVSFENGDVDERLLTGMSFTHKFTEKGEFRYFCRIHPEMRGSVLVK